MFVRVWEYRVDPTQVSEFERAYGGDGPWVELFARSAGFVETRLFRDHADGQRFITLDRWLDEASWIAFLLEWGHDYQRLDEQFDSLTVEENELSPSERA